LLGNHTRGSYKRVLFMSASKNEIFALHNFEGPLDFLISLIQKEEIDIYDVSIHTLTQQFLKKLEEWKESRVEAGAEFIGTTAYLVWLKSKTLLPKHEQPLIDEIEEEDPQFDIIHHLIDYCRFKQAAKKLSERQEQQSACFFRGASPPEEFKRPLGLDHISLEEFAQLFETIMQQTAASKGQIHEESWRVSDKVKWIRLSIRSQHKMAFKVLFSVEKSRPELIVTFLAVLELMKIGEIGVAKDEDGTIFLLNRATYD
jgi:segregation and condensation protein A